MLGTDERVCSPSLLSARPPTRPPGRPCLPSSPQCSAHYCHLLIPQHPTELRALGSPAHAGEAVGSPRSPACRSRRGACQLIGCDICVGGICVRDAVKSRVFVPWNVLQTGPGRCVGWNRTARVLHAVRCTLLLVCCPPAVLHYVCCGVCCMLHGVCCTLTVCDARRKTYAMLYAVHRGSTWQPTRHLQAHANRLWLPLDFTSDRTL